MSTNNDKKDKISGNEDAESNISATERSLLDESIENSLSEDESNLNRSMLSDTDDDGELLNEATSATDITGDDLDIPGAELDDDDEIIGEEDEENNGYSQADTA